MLVAETVDVFAVMLGLEAVIARGDSAFVDLVAAYGILDLEPQRQPLAGVYSSSIGRVGKVA